MPDTPTQHQVSEAVFVARQPIFRTDMSTFGYELLFRSSGDARGALVSDSNKATATVIADGFVLASAGVTGNKRFLVNFPEQLLLEGAAHALPAERCVVEILEDVKPTPEVLEQVRSLKEAGYTLAMDDFMGEPELEPFLQYVDIIKVDILGLGSTRQALEPVVKNLEKYNCRLLAEKVEDRDVFQLTKELGFTLFQGYFFSKPEIIPGKKVSSNEIVKLKLLQELGNPDFDIHELSRIIQSDMSLSYRLFQYINSAGMGVKHKVESVSRALALLGQRQISQWLRVIIMSDLNPSKEAEMLALMSVQRARFLELTAESVPDVKIAPEPLFTLGLFSMLDGILGMPMANILKELPLSDEIKIALVKAKGPFYPYLELVSSYDHNNWKQIARHIPALGLGIANMDKNFMDAMLWTEHIFSCGKQEC